MTGHRVSSRSTVRARMRMVFCRLLRGFGSLREVGGWSEGVLFEIVGLRAEPALPFGKARRGKLAQKKQRRSAVFSIPASLHSMLRVICRLHRFGLTGHR